MKKQRLIIGQTLVEFALLLPLLLLLLVGFLDIGRAIFYYSSLSNAVREGTRYAIVNKNVSDDDIKDKVLEFAFALADTPNPLEREKIEIVRLKFNLTDEKETNLSITATYTFQSIFFTGLNFDLVAQSTMRFPPHTR